MRLDSSAPLAGRSPVGRVGQQTTYTVQNYSVVADHAVGGTRPAFVVDTERKRKRFRADEYIRGFGLGGEPAWKGTLRCLVEEECGTGLISLDTAVALGYGNKRHDEQKC